MASLIASLWPRAILSFSSKRSQRLVVACLLALGGLIHAQTAVSGAQSWLPSYATYPYGIAADGSGNIFVAVNNSGTISEVIRSGGAYTAGPSIGEFNRNRAEERHNSDASRTTMRVSPKPGQGGSSGHDNCHSD